MAEQKRCEAEAAAIEKRFKSGDVKRFEAALQAYNGGTALASSDYAGFLDHLVRNDIKEFGKGTQLRKNYLKDVKGGTETASKDFTESRGLEKVGRFGRRRKAETATINSVEAAGHALDAVGTFTAAGDLGATKLSGKVLKAGSALYKGVKGVAKRAKRVHQLRTAKNDVGYGGKDERGVGWGIKQFFGGDVAGSQKKVKKAMKGGGATTYTTDGSVDEKGVDKLSGMSPEQIEKTKKRLTMQALRRVGDLIDCLGSSNDKIFHRASQILHIIAETNLAGALKKIEDSDLQKFRGLYQKVKGQTASTDEETSYRRQRGAIKEIFTMQLQGVGG